MKMKRKVYFIVLMGMAFLLMISGIAFGAGHENPPGTMLAGPPVVGTLILDPVSDPAPMCLAYDGSGACTKLMIFVNYKFSGCCADCSDASCKPSCNMKMNKFEPFAAYTEGIVVTEHDGVAGLTLADATPADLETYYMANVDWLSKNCNSSSDIMIEKVWKLTAADIDNDGVQELLANIIVLYVVPVSQ
jgi:hypothetical protein